MQLGHFRHESAIPHNSLIRTAQLPCTEPDRVLRDSGTFSGNIIHLKITELYASAEKSRAQSAPHTHNANVYNKYVKKNEKKKNMNNKY